MALPFELDERLRMLSALVPACPVAADIGADHGFLGAWLLSSGRCERVQFLDISEPSLAKARRLIASLQLEDRAVFGVGDGAQAMTEPAQAAIIAGMGGPTMCGIIERGQEKLGDAQLILQANMGLFDLRERLTQLHYRIDREELVRAGRRWYIGMRAVRGEAKYTRRELLFGPCLLADRHPRLPEYAAFRIRVLEDALAGVRKTEGERAERIEKELNEEKKLWEEVRT